MMVEASVGRAYYLARRPAILAQYETHAAAWRPFLDARYGAEVASAILVDSRSQYEALIPEIPYIGGDANRLTRDLVRSTTSLVLYEVMRPRGATAADVGKIVYDAVLAAVGRLPPAPSLELTEAFVTGWKTHARRSHERRYPGDWVYDYVEGDGVTFDYGLDFLECGTQKLYRARGVEAFLPFYCYLDFVTHRTPGWGFARSGTLAEGCPRCDFRWKKGGHTERGWPPPFL